MKIHFSQLLIILTIIVSSCKYNRKLEVIPQSTNDQTSVSKELITDTLEYRIFKNLINEYSIPEYIYVLSQDKKGNYYNSEINGKWQKEIKYDSLKMSSASFWSFGKESEKFIMKYYLDGKIKEVTKYKRFQQNEPMKVKSIERYKYQEGLLETMEFIDFLRMKSFVDSTTIEMKHNYDNQKRLSQTIISKRSGERNYFNVDTVNYFYKSISTIPYKVLKSAFEGTEYKITKTSTGELEIVRIHKETYNDNIAVIKTKNYFKFDEYNRVKEYQLTTDVNIPNELTEVKYEKYNYAYSSELNLKKIPKLLYHYGQQNVIPNSDVLHYFTSNVEIGGYPNVALRTDLSNFELPKSIERFKSQDGINWKPSSKYENKNDSM